MTRPVGKGAGGGAPQTGSTAAVADGKAESASRIKTLYRIMQSVEVRWSKLAVASISNA
jgi:hypothetical protein